MTVPDIAALNAVARIVLLSEASAVAEPFAERRNQFGPDVLALLDQGRLLPATDYVNAQRHRARLVAEMAATMQAADLLVTPTWDNSPAPLYAGEEGPLFPDNFTMPFNVTGYPALCVCSGFGPGGLPVSVQIVGKPFQDAMVLRVGDAFEKATQSRSRRPALVA